MSYDLFQPSLISFMRALFFYLESNQNAVIILVSIPIFTLSHSLCDWPLFGIVQLHLGVWCNFAVFNFLNQIFVRLVREAVHANLRIDALTKYEISKKNAIVLLGQLYLAKGVIDVPVLDILETHCISVLFLSMHRYFQSCCCMDRIPSQKS